MRNIMTRSLPAIGIGIGVALLGYYKMPYPGFSSSSEVAYWVAVLLVFGIPLTVGGYLTSVVAKTTKLGHVYVFGILCAVAYSVNAIVGADKFAQSFVVFNVAVPSVVMLGAAVAGGCLRAAQAGENSFRRLRQFVSPDLPPAAGRPS